MNIELTAAETDKWQNEPEWRAGFLVALQYCIPDGVMTVEIQDSNGVRLAAYVRKWEALP